MKALVRAIRWSATAQFIHPATLDRFHDLVSMMSEADSTGSLRIYLTRTDEVEYPSLTSTDVFDRSLGAMIDDMPGLMHAIFDRDDEVLGHVTEAEDSAHVVYRTTARISGAVSEVKVMQLGHTDSLQPRFLDERLRDPDSPGVSNPYEFRVH